jgi:putative ABC transport system permease protein
MIYPKMALSNIKKNGKLYIPYIITSVLTVMMFFMVNSLVNSDSVAKMEDGENIISLLNIALAVSYIFSAIFLFYTNSFLMKRRKKEIGLYNILGMEKRHISIVMFCENVFVAIISLATGIILGIVFGKLMFLVLMKLIKSDSIPAFAVPINSIIQTVLFFLGVFIATFLYNIIKVYRTKTIELLHGGEIGEKEPKTKLIMAILGLALVGGGYYFALTIESVMKAINFFFVAVLFVVIGTYLLFTAGSIAFIKLLKKNKKFYYKTGHFTSVSGMLYRMKQNAVGLANICVLSTVVLIAVATTVSLYAGMQDSLDSSYPKEQNILASFNDDSAVNVIEERIDQYVKNHNANVKNKFSYMDIFFNGSLNENNEFLTNGGKGILSSNSENEQVCNLMTVSDFNSITGSNYSIENSDSIIFATNENINDDGTFSIKTDEGKLTYKIDKKIPADGVIQDGLSGVIKCYVVIVKDMNEVNNIRKFVYNTEEDKYYNKLTYNIYFDTDLSEEDSKALSNDITKDDGMYNGETLYYISCNNRYDMASALSQMYGGLLFLGCFVGILFLMATVLIIYYKQISEGYEDRSRFEIMMKVGMSHEEVKKTIKSQILMVFFIPILVAIIHVAVSFRIVKMLMSVLSLGNNSTLFIMSTVVTVVIFFVIYAIVYAITAKAYYNIVNGK